MVKQESTQNESLMAGIAFKKPRTRKSSHKKRLETEDLDESFYNSLSH